MTPELTPHPPAVLGQNQYGKAETRLVRIVRDGDPHQLRDLRVSVALAGDLTEVHYSGDNAAVLPTDSVKNTVFAFAQRYGVASPEEFGMRLAHHFVSSQPTLHSARVRLQEYGWERIETPGGTVPHSFVRAGRETRTTQVDHDGESWQLLAGLTDLTVLNTTDSEFHGFVTDPYTTLPETRDRVLATEVTALWRYGSADGQQPVGDWDLAYREIRAHLLAAFAETYSRSLQQTLYQMGARVIEHQPQVEEVRLSLPNQHHFLVDLTPFGQENPDEVYFAADRPYGLIEGTVLREGAEARIPVDLIPTA